MNTKHYAYYNEIDPNAAAWIRELIKSGAIMPGTVDERSIADVAASDLHGFTRCHFFAGIAGWELALQLVGWPEDRPVWTGSAPCQPFSVGNVAHGGGKGKADARHLAPVFVRLIGQCRPSVVFGEQVAAAVGKEWWDEAACELERCGYACAAAVLPACAYGAEHERKRLFWGAHSSSPGWKGHQPIERIPKPASAALAIIGHPLIDARRVLAGDCSGLLPCDGLSVVVERHKLRGFGNAIVPQVAAEFIQAFMSA